MSKNDLILGTRVRVLGTKMLGTIVLIREDFSFHVRFDSDNLDKYTWLSLESFEIYTKAEEFGLI